LVSAKLIKQKGSSDTIKIEASTLKNIIFFSIFKITPMSIQIETDLKDVLGKIDQKLDKLEDKLE
jgi:hypothetical protein